MFTMRLFHRLWLFILWLNMDPSLQQNATTCKLPLPPPKGTTYEPAFRNVFSPGDTVTVTCGEWYWISLPQNTSVVTTCKEDGEWSVRPICKAEIKCTVPVIENGNVLGDIQEYDKDEILHFECNMGYMRTENISSKCTNLGTKAGWSPKPTCETSKCKVLLPPLEGTTYEPAFRNVFSPSDTLRVKCGERYWISHPQETSAVTTCKDNGEWSVTPICKEVTCDSQRDPLVYYWDVYWEQKITLNETVSYWCMSGYKSTDGAIRATCTRYGWRPNPLCQEITCDRYDVQNTDIVNYKQKYSYYERASYVCKDGYTGRFFLTCTEDGWSGKPQCKEVTCDKQYYENADIDGDETQSVYKYNDQVKYVCKNDYVGNFSITCGTTGWIGSPECTEKPCEKLNISDAYITRNEKETYKHNERVHYTCRNASERRFTVVCHRGNWIGIQGCTECPLAEVPHGFIVGPHNETLYYTCEDGYKLATRGWWGEAKCIHGLWFGLEQCIEKSKCGEPPLISNGKVISLRNSYEPGESVQIICKEGYSTPVDHFTCVKGKWNSNGAQVKTICAPIANHCSPPPKVDNAVVVSSYQKEYLSGSKVTYHCRYNYTLEGEATITCNDGKWVKRNFVCAPPFLEL
ncbi:complement factor H isoform X2 [Lates calcarifer]|uniref:Complement factor H isoform X2 n=1 Tax=Lates calcarifer TaxID=8187 RepID=A0AAJ8BI99_LATCA|nr:complement factor H isoform X2 [Lates calcarifer]